MGKFATTRKRGSKGATSAGEPARWRVPIPDTDFVAMAGEGEVIGVITAVDGGPYAQMRMRPPTGGEWLVGNVAWPADPILATDPSVQGNPLVNWDVSVRWGGTSFITAAWSPWSAVHHYIA